MPSEDTIKLLRECNAGTKMAIESIEEVIKKVQSKSLLDLLERFLKEHKHIETETHKKLDSYEDTEKSPNPIAEVMAKAKINMNLMMHPIDKEIAELMIDGCNMGIKSVSRYINQYALAQSEEKDLAEQLIKLEQKFMDELRVYL